MDPTLLDAGLRGATVALLLLLAGCLLRDHGRRLAGRLGALFALGSAAFAVTSAPGFGPPVPAAGVPLLALAAGNNVVFCGLAAALFDDGFRLRPWHAALWLLLVAGGVAGCFLASPVLGLALTLSSLAFAGLAIAQVAATWRADLVEGRRRLRLFVVGASGLYIAVNAIAQLAGVARQAPQDGALVGALALFAIAATATAALLHVGMAELLFGAAPAHPAVAPPTNPAAPAPPPAAREDAADAAHLVALERLMTADRIYRQDGLTIADLAGRLGLPEYRLRRLINQALGHRNFNSFVNGYRLAEVRSALADAGQAEVPVLTVALDAGFRSLGPFNRAFKAETGLTPTEYRRAALGALAESGNAGPPAESANRNSKSRSRRLAAS